MAASEQNRRFALVLVKPSHYDDDGYVIQWLRSPIPSTTLANLYGLAHDCAERRVLGPDVEIVITALDETNTRIRPARIARLIAEADGGLVGLVGVQSNEFPRAMDLARDLRRRGIAVCIGGFHVSGSLAMLPKPPPELEAAMALGISLFAGEAEGRLEQVLGDAWAGSLKPLYNYMDDLPSIAAMPPPVLPASRIKRIAGSTASFDAGRGCPFQCSFCTIINVQGRQSRRRTADDVEEIVRRNVAQGITHFFITDDNFARNRDWEAIFDRLAELREREQIKMKFIIQVDTLCHLIPNFIAKAKRAGVSRAFIGLENINPENLLAAKKRQNRITEYRKMLLEWRDQGITTYGGYILGFPGDTPERIERDIEIMQRELPIDMVEFFCLTPLPGSEDHQKLYQSGAWLDPDLNKYDLEHVVQRHPIMSKEDWEGIYQRAWRRYYAPEHLERMMRRSATRRRGLGNISFLILWFYGSITIEHVHPLQGGYFRRKYRRGRRPGLPVENPLVFYPRYLGEVAVKHIRLLHLFWRLRRIAKRVLSDPEVRNYRDEALAPVDDEELDRLELFTASAGAKSAVAKARKEEEARARIAG